MLNEIRDKIAQFVQGHIPISEFKEWFITFTVNIQQAENLELRKTVGEVLGRLAEYSQGHWSENELKHNLAPIAGVFFVNLQQGSSVGNLSNFSVSGLAWPYQPNAQATANSRQNQEAVAA
jgi:hypothetical protein